MLLLGFGHNHTNHLSLRARDLSIQLLASCDCGGIVRSALCGRWDGVHTRAVLWPAVDEVSVHPHTIRLTEICLNQSANIVQHRLVCVALEGKATEVSFRSGKGRHDEYWGSQVCDLPDQPWSCDVDT